MKTDTEIEQLLIKERDLSLKREEKLSIKTMLLDHAAQTLRYEKRPVVSPWMSWLTKGSMALASLLIVASGTGYASQSSLPGEPLYAVKVNMVEEMVELTKINPRDRIAYDITLMETRLSEIKEILAQDETLQSEDFEVLTDQIEEHVDECTQTLNQTENTVMTYEQKIEALTALSGVAKAQVRITQDDAELTGVSDTLEGTRKSASNALESTVEHFVDDESAEVVHDYLSDQITEVGAYIQASTTDARIRDSALRHIHDVDEALTDGDADEAVMSILEAQEVFTVHTYLKDTGTSQD